MNNTYISPFSTRYASKEMQYIFSDDFKFTHWRKLWLALAEAEQALGIEISDVQIAELRANVDNINYEEAQERERKTRHDVMSHVYAYGLQCPSAKGIIHLGATSCFVGDNTDIIMQKEALELVLKKLISVIALLAAFADKYKGLPALAYTHLQAAQPTTVGKRATLWLNDFVKDVREIEHRLACFELRGCKGTTGTQASFLELFSGDAEKVFELDRLVCQKMGYDKTADVTGQTYTRKEDYYVLSTLSALAQSAYKFSSDMRMLQAFHEVEEPFGKQQIGSSAMPYKRNPMRCERISALARFVMIDCLNTAFTASSQWFERTLDDSANRRIAISEGFLAVDSILNIMLDVCSNLVVYEKVIRKRLMDELPFMATENILINAVKQGGNRQELHEKIRVYAQETAYDIKMNGKENNLLEKLVADSDFHLTWEEIHDILDPQKFIGLADKQTENYLRDVVQPLLQQYAEYTQETAELSV